ncbi:MAG: hypothetical protein F6K21_35075 [Symploca sp. SIO2D2]|nr:hypothetical protein [Symploca sp. SIO2D2]
MNIIRNNKLYLVLISIIIGVAIILATMPLAAQAKPLIPTDANGPEIEIQTSSAQEHYNKGLQYKDKGLKYEDKAVYEFRKAAQLFCVIGNDSKFQIAKTQLCSLEPDDAECAKKNCTD